jgi:hypothetical protein
MSVTLRLAQGDRLTLARTGVGGTEQKTPFALSPSTPFALSLSKGEMSLRTGVSKDERAFLFRQAQHERHLSKEARR